jgi:ubiquinone/menaquinone biosynthesis C-methylase UbiE
MMNDSLIRTFEQVENVHWWWSGRRQLVKYLIGHRRPKKILDIGAGTGQTLLYMKKLYPKADLHGVDASTVAVNLAHHHGLAQVKKAKAEKLPFTDNTFDLILMLDVLEHIKNDTKAITEAKRVLKTGGHLIVTTPALQFIWSDHDENQGHFRRYTRHMMRDLSEKTGFDLDFVSYFNFFLSPIIITIRLLGNIKPLGYVNSYDSRLNYGLAEIGPINSLLEWIFIREIELLRHISYPIGISIATLFTKRKKVLDI